MERSLIWIESDANGWACSNCRWKFPVPTLLSGEEAKGAYDRLAAAKFRQHICESATSLTATLEAKRDANTAFAERARTLIKRGYKPKVAVELVLQETEIEHGNDPRMMEKARADADDFLQRVRKGLI
jgi:pyruvate kinase